MTPPFRFSKRARGSGQRGYSREQTKEKHQKAACGDLLTRRSSYAAENAEFVACMENILELYQQPYDPRKPLWCMDEKP